MDIDNRCHLISFERISQLKARYCRYIDTKQWDRLPALFSEDCRFEGLGSAPAGADLATFVAGVSSRLGPTISVHHVHQPEIVLTSATTASAVWAMEDYVEWQDGGAVKEAPGAKGFRGYGHYEEEYRKEGGMGTTFGNMVSEALSPALGHRVLVDYKPGANGALGAGAVAKAPADGYTLLMAVNSTMTINPNLYAKLPFDPLKDFSPVSMVFTSANILVAHVPYRGSGPAVIDLLGGQLDFMFVDTAVLPHVHAGKLRALAVTGKKRLGAAPDIPTMEAEGVKGFYVDTWYSIAAPAGTRIKLD